MVVDNPKTVAQTAKMFNQFLRRLIENGFFTVGLWVRAGMENVFG